MMGPVPFAPGGSLSPSNKRDRAGPAEGRGRARGLGPASRTRDPPRAGEGLRWGGAANQGGQRDRLAVERLTGGRAALGPRQSWRRAWTRLQRRRRDVERVGPCMPVSLCSVWAALASWDERTGAHCCCLHPTWEIICTLSPACSSEVHCSMRTHCSPRAERILAGPI